MFKKFLILLFIFILSCTPPDDSTDGKVIKVSDGDSITLLTKDNEQIKIRLDGIDCPERKQEFGAKARKFTNDLCYGKNVRIEVRTSDRYQRKLAIVWVDSINVNEELLKNGLAWHYKRYNSSWKYAALERKAKMRKINIWSTPSPLPPWEFRNKKHE